jgi:hypothetical protein
MWNPHRTIAVMNTAVHRADNGFTTMTHHPCRVIHAWYEDATGATHCGVRCFNCSVQTQKCLYKADFGPKKRAIWPKMAVFYNLFLLYIN